MKATFIQACRTGWLIFLFHLNSYRCWRPPLVNISRRGRGIHGDRSNRKLRFLKFSLFTLVPFKERSSEKKLPKWQLFKGYLSKIAFTATLPELPFQVSYSTCTTRRTPSMIVDEDLRANSIQRLSRGVITFWSTRYTNLHIHDQIFPLWVKYTYSSQDYW